MNCIFPLCKPSFVHLDKIIQREKWLFFSHEKIINYFQLLFKNYDFENGEHYAIF